MRDECEHGSLRRSCSICDLLDDVRDLESQRDVLLARHARLSSSICDLVAESDGVAGLHKNGDLALWNDLLAGGRFEEWLLPLYETAAASLAHVQADAIDDAINQAKEADPVLTSEYRCDRLLQRMACYANSIRQSASQSEPATEIERRVKRSQDALDRPLRDTVRPYPQAGGDHE